MNYDLPYASKVIYYGDPAHVISVNNTDKELKSVRNKNPLIILNHLGNESVLAYDNIYYFANAAMFAYDDVKFQHVVTENHLENGVVYKTNVYDYYLNQWQTVKRTLCGGIVVLALVLFLEAFTIHTVIRLEYSINAVELSLKKVFGYPLLK